MPENTTVDLDLAKQVFWVFRADAAERVVAPKTVRRDPVPAFCKRRVRGTVTCH